MVCSNNFILLLFYTTQNSHTHIDPYQNPYLVRRLVKSFASEMSIHLHKISTINFMAEQFLCKLHAITLAPHQASHF